MATKIEITVTDNDHYMFIYVSKDGEVFDGVTIPKVMGIFTKRVLVRTVLKGVKEILTDVITKLVKGE